MSLLVAFTTLAAAINGLLAGLNIDTALVKLPARRRLGASAYATFARGNDLGNGLIVYPVLGISAALFTVLVTALAFVTQSRGEALLLLSLASLLYLGKFWRTVFGRAGRHTQQCCNTFTRYTPGA